MLLIVTIIVIIVIISSSRSSSSSSRSSGSSSRSSGSSSSTVIFVLTLSYEQIARKKKKTAFNMASKYVRILCGVQLFYWDCHRYARTNIWPWSLSPFPYLAVSSRTQKSDLGGFDFDSSRILILRGGIFMSIHMCIYIYIYIFIDLHRYRYRYRYRNILRYRD